MDIVLGLILGFLILILMGIVMCLNLLDKIQNSIAKLQITRENLNVEKSC